MDWTLSQSPVLFWCVVRLLVDAKSLVSRQSQSREDSPSAVGRLQWARRQLKQAVRTAAWRRYRQVGLAGSQWLLVLCSSVCSVVVLHFSFLRCNSSFNATVRRGLATFHFRFPSLSPLDFSTASGSVDVRSRWCTLAPGVLVRTLYSSTRLQPTLPTLIGSRLVPTVTRLTAHFQLCRDPW